MLHRILFKVQELTKTSERFPFATGEKMGKKVVELA